MICKSTVIVKLYKYVSSLIGAYKLTQEERIDLEQVCQPPFDDITIHVFDNLEQ